MSVEKRIEKNKKLLTICGVIMFLTIPWLFLFGSAELYWFLVQGSGYHAVDHYMEYINIPVELLSNFVKSGSVLVVIAIVIAFFVMCMFLKQRKKSLTIKFCTVTEILLVICLLMIFFDVPILWCLGGLQEVWLGVIFLCFAIFLIFCLCICVYTKALLKNINAKKRTVLAIVLLVIVFLVMMFCVRGYYHWLVNDYLQISVEYK